MPSSTSPRPPSPNIYIHTSTGRVQVLSFPDLKRIGTMKGHVSRVSCLAQSQDQAMLATGGMDAVAALWDAADAVCMRTFYQQEHPIRALGCVGGWRLLGGVGGVPERRGGAWEGAGDVVERWRGDGGSHDCSCNGAQSDGGFDAACHCVCPEGRGMAWFWPREPSPWPASLPSCTTAGSATTGGI